MWLLCKVAHSFLVKWHTARVAVLVGVQDLFAIATSVHTTKVEAAAYHGPSDHAYIPYMGMKCSLACGGCWTGLYGQVV